MKWAYFDASTSQLIYPWIFVWLLFSSVLSTARSALSAGEEAQLEHSRQVSPLLSFLSLSCDQDSHTCKDTEGEI